MVTENSIRQQLLAELAGQGYQGRIVSVHRVQDLAQELETHRREGRFDDTFDQERLTRFHFTPPETLPDVQSLIIVAVPRPQTQAVFTWHGQALPLIIPIRIKLIK